MRKSSKLAAGSAGLFAASFFLGTMATGETGFGFWCGIMAVATGLTSLAGFIGAAILHVEEKP